MTTREEDEPILVSGMRRWPTGSVRHDPGGGIGASGTSSAGFVREYDRAIIAAEERGAEQLAARLAEAVIAELAERHSTKLKQNPAWNRKDERAAMVADYIAGHLKLFVEEEKPEPSGLSVAILAQSIAAGMRPPSRGAVAAALQIEAELRGSAS